MNEGYPTRRLRRLRYHPGLRAMLGGIRLSVDELVLPLFVRDDVSSRREIATMPGQFQYPLSEMGEVCRRVAGKGLRSVILFGIPARKDAAGSGAWDERGIVQQAVAAVKQAAPDLVVMCDTCLCEYTDHGHCGPVAGETGRVDNEGALAALARTAVSQARAGADVIAPSAMMDGQVRTIRSALDAAGFEDRPILAYSAKFASALYGPFRAAAGSTPSFGDRRSYQMDYRSRRQYVAEVRADLAEGADMVMVKPAAAYLDILADLAGWVDVPLAAYHVSGEYAMIRFAAAAGALDEKQAVLEITTALKRAGADLIITYFAEMLAEWI